ncbi:hypothetical protein FACS1894151_06430 [Spirochaetia bacterium]|nr:hypothetical protein FACS1894151_06430 [Spirochaetia bacterium]
MKCKLSAGFMALCFFTAIVSNAAGAEISVPRLELFSHGTIKDGSLTVGTSALADITLNGGYKYGATLGFSLSSTNLEKAFLFQDENLLSFRVFQAIVRQPFALPVELSFFVGAADTFCSGDNFLSRFGMEGIGTDYRGFLYFPEGLGGNSGQYYSGAIHGIQGTGISLALTSWEQVVPVLYIYEDLSFIRPEIFATVPLEEQLNSYSADLGLLINTAPVKLELFGGYSYTWEKKTAVRGGLLAYLSNGKGVDFLAQAGIPCWIPGEDFSIDNLYFLMEPRIRFGIFAVHVTLFYHPLYYMNRINPAEQGKADVNFRFIFGNLDEKGTEGGLETTMILKAYDITDFVIRISPFFSWISGGMEWNLKIRINPLGFDDPSGGFDAFLGIRTSF